MSGLRRIAPTLAPPSRAALASGLHALLAPASSAGRLVRALHAMFPGADVVAFDSGRAALAAAIRIAMRATGRDRVVLPAYTSFSVAAAAAAAAAGVDLCDLDPSTLELDRGALRACVGDRTAAVVLGNLYGTPDRTDDLGWLRERSVVLIDDAAQALGAREGDRQAGLRGQLGVLSFGRGKCVTLGAGGALLVPDQRLAHLVEAERPRGASRGVWAYATAAATTVCAGALGFGVLSRLPGIQVGESWYDPDFTAAGTPSSAEGLSVDLADAVRRHHAARAAVARRWREALTGMAEVTLPAIRPGTEPAHLRLPVLAAQREAREAFVSRLGQARFTFVRSFPSTLGRIEGFRERCASRPTPGAEQVAAHVLTLPCHVAVGAEDVVRAVAAMRQGLPRPEPAPVGAASLTSTKRG